MLVFSVWVLIRGHNAPGGGFIAGLITSSAFSLYVIAQGTQKLREMLVFELSALLCTGLICALLSSMTAWLKKLPFLTACWVPFGSLFLGTPLLFDLGVYLVVTGGILIMVVALEEGGA